MNNKEEFQKRAKFVYDRFGVELEQVVEKFEEQYKKFMIETNKESYFQIVLRAHLYIEYEMIEISKISLKNPEELGNKLNFNIILKILLAIGAIPQELKEPINFLNKIRNSYAHELEYKFDDIIYDKFMKTFSIEFKKKSLSGLDSNDELSKKLKESLFALWLELIEIRLISEELKEELDNVLR